MQRWTGDCFSDFYELWPKLCLEIVDRPIFPLVPYPIVGVGKVPRLVNM